MTASAPTCCKSPADLDNAALERLFYSFLRSEACLRATLVVEGITNDDRRAIAERTGNVKKCLRTRRSGCLYIVKFSSLSDGSLKDAPPLVECFPALLIIGSCASYLALSSLSNAAFDLRGGSVGCIGLMQA